VLGRRSLVISLLALTAMTVPAAAQPKPDLWPRWLAHDETSRLSIDHGPWQALLSRRVSLAADGVARFAYAETTRDEKAALKAYLAGLSRVAISGHARPEQRAYWINLYNALTVDLILDRFPVESIRDISISPGFFSVGPWGRKLIEVEGEVLSLDDIEHRILRPIWKDPRLHYALNCASLGCPNLQATAFAAANAEALLDAAAREFVNHPRAARMVNGRLVVSSIYVWFREDFGGTDDGVIRHLDAHADPPLKQALRSARSVSAHDYDWRLNR
jgi:hypothetical protein